MKTKYLLSVMAIVALTKTGYAQYSQDVIRFSTAQTGSTARIKAIGNATTAIGGDLSSVSGNPAGLGFFTKSELSFTPEFNNFGAKTTYMGQTTNANTNTVNFNNVSGVIYSKLNTPKGYDKGQGWLSFNIGGSYNRTNDFYQGINYSGRNTANSISNYYAYLGNQYGVNTNNGSNLQDWAYAHNQIDAYTGGVYQSNVFNLNGAPNSAVNQSNNISREGGQTEFSIAMGANYSNKLYIGFGVGITNIRYNYYNNFNESGTASVTSTAVNSNYSSAYTQQQSTTGSGFNARLGVIYKPDPAFRIGATINTPTWYTINDEYSDGLRTQYTTGVVGSYTSGPSDYTLTYNFHTPWKFSGGMAVFLGKIGFITGDVEYLDYSSVRLENTDGYSASDDNHDIRNNYRSTVNVHAGAEVKLDQIYLRGGYGVQGNPQRNNGGDLKTISGGLGYRFMNYYIDATYTNVKGSQNLLPYLTADGAPVANIDKTYNNVFLTFGLRF